MVKVDDINIYKNVLDLEKQLKIVVHAWFKLLNDLSLEAYAKAIQERFSQAMEQFQFLAHLTEPTRLIQGRTQSSLLFKTKYNLNC